MFFSLLLKNESVKLRLFFTLKQSGSLRLVKVQNVQVRVRDVSTACILKVSSEMTLWSISHWWPCLLLRVPSKQRHLGNTFHMFLMPITPSHVLQSLHTLSLFCFFKGGRGKKCWQTKKLTHQLCSMEKEKEQTFNWSTVIWELQSNCWSFLRNTI